MTKNKYPIGGHIYVLLDEQYNKYAKNKIIKNNILML
jgi:hypothetical protein